MIGYTGPMRIGYVLLITLLTTALSVAPARGEAITVTVPSEATAPTPGENYATARKEAMRQAFVVAAYRAASGMAASPADLENLPGVEVLLRRAGEYVAGYKILGETIDAENQTLTLSMQVTLFADTLQKGLAAAGVALTRPTLPSLVILIDEQSMQFINTSNVLLLKSLSEETLADAFRDRGYRVADRVAVRQAGLDQVALAAMQGDREAQRRLASGMGASLLLLGKTVVVSIGAGGEEHVTAKVAVSMAPPGQPSAGDFTGVDSGVYADILDGSSAAIKNATGQVIRQAAEAIPAFWAPSRR